MENFIKRFNEFTAALNQPGIRVIYSDMKYFLNGSNLDTKENPAAAPRLEELYQKIEYMHCEWVYLSEENPAAISFLDKEADVIAGCLRLSSMSDLNNNESDIRDGENHYKIFDKVSDDRSACLKIENGIISDEIYWFDFLLGTSPVPLNVRVTEYLTTGFDNFFFLNWQQAFLKNDQKRKSWINYYKEQLFTH